MRTTLTQSRTVINVTCMKIRTLFPFLDPKQVKMVDAQLERQRNSDKINIIINL